uniref:Modular domain immune-type receptor n=1 Tax=Iconisemion striatum TaxID=60296 RepID=A0A1A7YEB4_9TELE
MKFLFFSICLLSDFPFLKGTKEFQNILLGFSFPSLYNSYHKFCCKLYPGGFYQLLDSSGYTCDMLRGRVTITEQNGWIEFEISNVQTSDAGYYRCGILGAQNHIYRNYYVQVFEASDRYSHTQPALTATMKGPNSSTTIPDSTVLSAPRSFGLPLIAVVSITGTIFIVLLIGAVYYKLKVKHRKSGPLGGTRSESLKQEVPEKNNIVYTTVDFRPHQRPEEVYENLRMQHDGTVEYSTLAIQE